LCYAEVPADEAAVPSVAEAEEGFLLAEVGEVSLEGVEAEVDNRVGCVLCFKNTILSVNICLFYKFGKTILQFSSLSFAC